MKKLKISLGALVAVIVFSLCLIVGTYAADIVAEGGVACTCGGGDAHNMVSWELDSEGHLEIWQNAKADGCTNGYYQFYISGAADGEWQQFINAHGNDVVSINVGSLNKIMYSGSSNYGVFCNMANLETVRFVAGQEIQRNWGKGIFENCTNLKSVVFGTAPFIDGNVDLSSGNLKGFTQYIFKNCYSIQRVVLPTSVTAIGQNMFYSDGNNSSLKEVVCLGNITSIGSTAFFKCVSLTSLSFQNSDFTVTAKAFTSWHNWNLKVSFADGSTTLPANFPVEKNADNGVYGNNNKVTVVQDNVYGANAKLPDGLNRTLKHAGYAVRTSTYNGLRSIFVHDNNAKSTGYTLKEYGVLATPETKKDSFSFALSDVYGAMFSGASVFAIERNGEIVEGAKILSNLPISQRLPEILDGTYFALSIVRYPASGDNMTSGVYFAGYEIFEDASGNSYIVYTDYSTDGGSSDYVSPSYYDIGLSMYKSGVLNREVDGSNVVWNDICTAGAVTLSAGTDYLNVLDTSKDPLTKEDPTDIDGNAFGDTFTLTEVPIATKKIITLDDGTKCLDLTQKSGITYTILKDGTDYVLIFRTEDGVSGKSLPSLALYTNEPFGLPFFGFNINGGSKWYGVTWSSATNIIPNGYKSVTAKRYQPLLHKVGDRFLSGIKTVVIDKGITGIGSDAFARLQANTYVASSDLKTLSGSPFVNAEGLTTFHIGGGAEEGVVDLSALGANVTKSNLTFSKENGVKMKMVRLSSAVSEENIPTTQGWSGVSEKFVFVRKVAGKDYVYIPTTYEEGGSVLEKLKANPTNIIFNFYDTEYNTWVKKTYNTSTGKFEEVTSDESGNPLELINERAAGYTSTVGTVYDKSQNWEVKVFGTQKDGTAISDKNVTIKLGDTTVTATLENSLRCVTFDKTYYRNAKRENFTYCPVTNVAYVADYISIKCVNGAVSATLNTFNASSTYDSTNKVYNKIEYDESPLTLSATLEHNVVKNGVKISSTNGFYTDVIYTSAIPDLEPIDYEVTKALTKAGNGVNSIARNVFVSEDGKTAYLCSNNSWQSYDGVSGSGAWLLEISNYDTANPQVTRKVLLNNLGNCKELIAKGILDEDCHGPNCPGRDLQTMGRACTGVTESGDYLYAVERYTGAFDINQRLTNIGANGDTTKDDGNHGHGVSFLCIIDKTTFKIVKQIPLNNDATSVEINPYDGKLYVMEMTRNWSVFDIDGDNAADPKPLHRFSQNGEFGGDDAEKVAAYALGTSYIEYQRATFWTDGNGNNYMAMSAFSGGATIWNITDVANRIPTREAWIKIYALNNNIGGRHVFDVAASYPYLYITVGGCVSERHSDGSLADGVIRLDVTNPKLLDMSDSSNVNTAKSLAVHAGIPYDFTADRCDEGDPAPSRIIVKDNVLLLNYSDKGVAFFRIGDNGIPVFDKVADFTNGDPQTMKLNPATGGIVIVNGEGAAKTPGLYEIQILN